MRCRRCGRTQPPLPAGVFHCLYCGTALPLPRWVAHPPPGVPPGPRRERRAVGPGARYAGPPSYGAAFPRWGFPPSRWQRLDDTDRDDSPRPPLVALSTAALAALLTTLLAAVATAGEVWRFALLLRGRTEVLSGGLVQGSDALVLLGGWLLLVFGILTAGLTASAVIRAHRAADAFAGKAPVRTDRQLAIRVLVPVVNLWGLGQILTEIEDRLTGPAPGTTGPRTSRLLRWWWLAWVASGVLMAVTLGRGLGSSTQAVADSVQLHIALDAVAVVLAALTAALLFRIARLFRGERRRGRYASWSVAPPAPTRSVVRDPQAARRTSGVLPPTGTVPELDDVRPPVDPDQVLTPEPVEDGTGAAGTEADG